MEGSGSLALCCLRVDVCFTLSSPRVKTHLALSSTATLLLLRSATSTLISVSTFVSARTLSCPRCRRTQTPPTLMHERSSACRRELKQSVRGNRSGVCLSSEQIHLSTAVRSGDRSDRGKEILDQIKSGGWFRGKQVDDLRGIRQHAELPPPKSNCREKNRSSDQLHTYS